MGILKVSNNMDKFVNWFREDDEGTTARR